MNSFKVGTMTVKILPEEYPSNPRKEFDNVTTMVCWHDRYDLGDEQPSYSPEEYLISLVDRKVEGFEQRIEKLDDLIDDSSFKHKHKKLKAYRDNLISSMLDKYYLIGELFLYDHSGITIRMGRFSCSWDSGPVGYVVVDRVRAAEEWGTKTDDEYIELMKGEVEVYDQYLTGDVWGYVIEDEHGEEVDSCWGFYGYENCKEQARSQAEYFQRDKEERLGEEMLEDYQHHQFELPL